MSDNDPGSERTSDDRSRTWLAPGGILLLAASVRFATLSQQSFWDDEGYTVGLMHENFAALFRSIAKTESAPPLYYVLAWFWTHLFGVSEAGLRSLSALAGVLTVAVVYLTVLRLAPRGAALIAAALVAVNPLMIWYSQEARAYALYTLFASLGLLYFVRALTGPDLDPREVWCWAGCSGLAMATHYFALFLVVPEALALLWRARRLPKRRMLGPIALLGVLGLIELPLALDQRAKHFGFTAAPLGRRVSQIPEQILVGYGVWATPAGKIAACIAAAAVGYGLWLVVKQHGRLSYATRSLLAVAAAALAAPIVFAVLGLDYVLTLYFLPLAALGLLLAPVGWHRKRSGVAAAIGYALVSIAVEAAVVTDPHLQREDIRGAASYIAATCMDRAIVVTPPTVLRAYLSDLQSMPHEGAKVREIDLLAMPVKIAGHAEAVQRGLRTARPSPHFILSRKRLASRFTVYAFTSPAPRRVTESHLKASRLGNWSVAQTSVLLERCNRTPRAESRQ